MAGPPTHIAATGLPLPVSSFAAREVREEKGEGYQKARLGRMDSILRVRSGCVGV